MSFKSVTDQQKGALLGLYISAMVAHKVMGIGSFESLRQRLS